MAQGIKTGRGCGAGRQPHGHPWIQHSYIRQYHIRDKLHLNSLLIIFNHRNRCGLTAGPRRRGDSNKGNPVSCRDAVAAHQVQELIRMLADHQFQSFRCIQHAAAAQGDDAVTSICPILCGDLINRLHTAVCGDIGVNPADGNLRHCFQQQIQQSQFF